MKRFVCIALILCLSGCYSPEQAALDARVDKAIVSGMPVKDAVTKLEKLHFQCSENGDFLDCTPIQEESSQYFCTQRVRLISDGDRLTSVEIRDNMCIGR